MCKEEAEDAPKVMTGTFTIQTQPIDILFDSGATHSFISAKLVETLQLVPTHTPPLLSAILPNEKTVKCDELDKDCPTMMYEHELLADLYRFELTDFGVILEMDWLAKVSGSNKLSKTKNHSKGAQWGESST